MFIMFLFPHVLHRSSWSFHPVSSRTSFEFWHQSWDRNSFVSRRSSAVRWPRRSLTRCRHEIWDVMDMFYRYVTDISWISYGYLWVNCDEITSWFYMLSSVFHPGSPCVLSDVKFPHLNCCRSTWPSQVTQDICRLKRAFPTKPQFCKNGAGNLPPQTAAKMLKTESVWWFQGVKIKLNHMNLWNQILIKSSMDWYETINQ